MSEFKVELHSVNAGLGNKERDLILLFFVFTIIITSLHESGSFFDSSHGLNEVAAHLLSGVNELSR